MSILFVIGVSILVVAQFAVPRRIAFMPLLIAVCHFQNETVVELGASFSPVKLVILAGLLRAARDRSLVWSSRQPLDLLIGVWAVWAVLSGFAHNPRDHNPISVRLSMVYDAFGAYLYARAYLKDSKDFLQLGKSLALVMLPLAFLVVTEKVTHRNLYGAIAGGIEEVTIRDGRVRAAGPFSHPILLGTFAACAVALLVPLLRLHRRFALLGLAACAVMVLCSASSGPILTLASAMAALVLWRWRTSVPWLRRGVILGIVALHLIMEAEVWYLMARIDLTGSSTGYHRAELITQAINHLDEWWLVGTDYTRHWMPYGVDWSGDQTDITNHYLKMGVTGGVPLMLAFIAVLTKAFQLVGRRMRELRRSSDPFEFTFWCLGVALFAHCVTFLSVSYFDQSNIPLFLVVGTIAGLRAACPERRRNKSSPATKEHTDSRRSEGLEPRGIVA